MFTKLRMTNFKSWVDTGDVKLAPLTGFFGTNSSGKSSILQMLLLLKQTTESNDRNLVLRTGSIQEGYVNLGTPNEITYGDTTDMSLCVEWDLSHHPQQNETHGLLIPIPGTNHSVTINHLEFETHIHAEQQKIHVSNLIYRQNDDFKVQMIRGGNNQYTITVQVKGNQPRHAQGRPRVYMKPEKCYGFSDEALRFYQDTYYLSDIVLGLEQQFQRLHYLGPLRDYPQRSYVWGGEHPSNIGLKGERAILALLAGKNTKVYAGKGQRLTLERRIAEWLVSLGLADSFETRSLSGSNQYEVRIKRHQNSPEVLITDLGIGVSQILPVLVLCYYAPEGSTIILEQPELHLHPSVQSGLADVFIDVIQKRNVQIILESHSEHLLRRLQRRIAEGIVTPDNTALYFCDLVDGRSQIQSLKVDQFGQIYNWPPDFFGDVAGDMVATLDAGLERQQQLT